MFWGCSHNPKTFLSHDAIILMMLSLVFSSLTLGFAFCAPPGVVTAEAVRRGLGRGFWPALWVGLGSMIGDGTWVIIALVGADFLVQNATARLLLGGIGTLFLVYLAVSALREAYKGELPAASNSERGDFATGMMLSLGNPFAVAFWLGVGSSTITTSVANPQGIHYVIFFLAIMAAALTWSFFLAWLITRGRRFIQPAFFRWVNLLCGLVLGYLAYRLFWDTLFR